VKKEKREGRDKKEGRELVVAESGRREDLLLKYGDLLEGRSV
jgi:hypothetical protein